MGFNKNVVVIATKLQKKRNDVFRDDWRECEDFKNISGGVKKKFGEGVVVLPLKFSRVFDNIFEEGLSIRELMDKNALSRHSYREVAKQFDVIYNLMGI